MRDELYLMGHRAVQERDTKMNEEIQIARDQAQKGDVLYERITQRDQEFDDVICELAASRQKPSNARPGYLYHVAEMAKEIEEARHEIKVQEELVCQLAETNRELTGFCFVPVYQDPMMQAHIDQLHEAAGSIPNITFQLATMEVVVTEMAVRLALVIATWMVRRGVKDVFHSKTAESDLIHLMTMMTTMMRTSHPMKKMMNVIAAGDLHDKKVEGASR